jgi:hypothetical protein
MDSIEGKAKEVTYDDLKIEIHEREVEREKNSPIGRLFRQLTGEDPPEPA